MLLPSQPIPLGTPARHEATSAQPLAVTERAPTEASGERSSLRCSGPRLLWLLAFAMSMSKTPMKFGGTSVPQIVAERQTSIFQGLQSTARIHLPTENPKYPETKHTVK